LTATNEAGSTIGSVTLTVTPAITGKPDLVITDIWLSGSLIYYTIKNQGNAEARPSWSALYVYDFKEATSYVDSLAAGEERTASFSNWRWPYPPPAGGGFGTAAPKPFEVKVCADAENAIEESDKDNNCTTVIWGVTFTYDFVKNAHLAKWRSSAGDLK
jgi:subtilase family serine protease